MISPAIYAKKEIKMLRESAILISINRHREYNSFVDKEY